MPRFGIQSFGSRFVELEVDLSACKGICARRGAGGVRHIETPTLWLQSAVSRKKLRVNKVAGKFNPSDLGTKVLTFAELQRYLDLLGLRFVTGKSSSQLSAAKV